MNGVRVCCGTQEAHSLRRIARHKGVTPSAPVLSSRRRMPAFVSVSGEGPSPLCICATPCPKREVCSTNCHFTAVSVEFDQICGLFAAHNTPGVCTFGLLHLLALAPFNRVRPWGANRPHPALLARCPRPSSGASHPLAAAVALCRRHRSGRFRSSGAPFVLWPMIQILPSTWCNRTALRAQPRRPSGASHATTRTLCRRRISCRFRSSGGPCTSSSVNAARKQTSSGAGWTISSLTQV